MVRGLSVMLPNINYWPQCQVDDEILFSPIRIINQSMTLVELIRPLITRDHKVTSKQPHYLAYNLVIPPQIHDQKIYIIGKVTKPCTRLRAGTVVVHPEGGVQNISCQGCDAYFSYKKPYLICENCNKTIRNLKVSDTYGQQI